MKQCVSLKNGYLFLIAFMIYSCQNDSPNNSPSAVTEQIAALGEGALWNPLDQSLLWIDILDKKLHIHKPQTGENREFDLPQMVGTVVPSGENQVLVALQDGIYELSTENGDLKKAIEAEPGTEGNRFNDGKCDPAGRFWVGTMAMNGEERKGSLYRIDGDYSLNKKIDTVSISNGIVWSLDKTKMYYIDTPTKRVMEYQYDNATGDISNPREAIIIPDSLGLPDGSTLDAEGMLWIAMWNGHCVSRWNPSTGELLQTINIPALNVTSCAFGGENLDILYVTTAEVGMDGDQKNKYPDAGKLFAVKPGVKGVPAFVFDK